MELGDVGLEDLRVASVELWHVGLGDPGVAPMELGDMGLEGPGVAPMELGGCRAGEPQGGTHGCWGMLGVRSGTQRSWGGPWGDTQSPGMLSPANAREM